MQQSWAIRLHRDFKELATEPLEGIEVHVHENDIKRMCLILSPLSGPYSGWRLHLEVTIPVDYPRSPPMVAIQTPVPHPNVFGSDICCDILKEGHFYKGGYSPGYLLKYIFLQILSFFSSTRIEQGYGGNVDLERHASKHSAHWKVRVESFQCSACGFNTTFSAKPTEPQRLISKTFSAMFEVPKVLSALTESVSAEGVTDKQSANLFQRLNDDCCLEILDRLSDQDAIKLTQAFDVVKEVADSHNCLLRRQLVCFYLRTTFHESVLGIGVQLTEQRKPVVTMLDLVSHEAFSVHGVRKGVTGTDFCKFLPVALNDDHFRRAQGVIRQCLMMLSTMGLGDRNSNAVLRTIPPMMNRMVLELVQSCDAEQAGRMHKSDVKRASEKALQGYCLLFHLLSKLVRSDPKLANEIQQKVNRFMEKKGARHKSSVPDLGEFLTYLLVTDNVDWTQACGVFLEELLARNVVWYLKTFPHLAYLEPDKYISERRLRDTFSGSRTSLRLVMFQVNFFNITRSRVAEFDQRYGYPSSEMSANLFKSIKDIYSVKDWDVFMKLIGYQLPASDWRMNVAKMLKAGVRLSEKSGYHSNPYSESELYVLRRDVEIGCPPPRSWPGSREEQYESRTNCQLNVNYSGRSFFPGSKRSH